MAKTIKSYKFYSDSGHGWMAVKRKELVELGILDSITSYSYQRGATVYLEEDCDATTFILALKKAGYQVMLSSSGKNSNLLDVSGDKVVRFIDKYTDRSPIRSYDHFRKVAI